MTRENLTVPVSSARRTNCPARGLFPYSHGHSPDSPNAVTAPNDYSSCRLMRIIRSPRPVDDFAGNDKKIAREYPEAARGRIIRILVQSILILALVAVSASAQDRSEIKKIDFLIESVEKLQGAKFIRNGSEYSGKEAADHLKMKLRKTGGRVRTADDFIRLCASKSYLSGKPYLIRYANGKTINSEKYFREQLLLYKNNN